MRGLRLQEEMDKGYDVAVMRGSRVLYRLF
jgi:hypothetical protein